jgi:hydrogenase maturation factor
VDVSQVSARPGDYILVQGGIAVTVMDAEAAREMLEAWEDVGGSIGA